MEQLFILQVSGRKCYVTNTTLRSMNASFTFTSNSVLSTHSFTTFTQKTRSVREMVMSFTPERVITAIER